MQQNIIHKIRKTAIATLGLLVLYCTSSCQLTHDDQAVARVGKTTLYKSEVEKYIPAGLPHEDSLALAKKYIYNWASELIMNDMAQQQMSKAELDVSKEVEEYRSSLLKYRYEQHFIQSRLDTTVTDEEILAHYNANASAYSLSIPIAKARYLRIPKTSPMKERLHKLLASEDEASLYLLDSLSYSNADKYSDYKGKWVDMTAIARDYGTDYGSLIACIKDKYIDITDEQGMEHITYLVDYIPSGKIPPVEYCRDRIKETIVSRRKYELSKNLEQELINNALEKGKFIIFDNEDN